MGTQGLLFEGFSLGGRKWRLGGKQKKGRERKRAFSPISEYIQVPGSTDREFELPCSTPGWFVHTGSNPAVQVRWISYWSIVADPMKRC